MTDNITLPREVVGQLLKMLEMVEPYADQFTDYSSTAAEWPLNLLPKKVSEAIAALRTALAAEPTKVSVTLNPDAMRTVSSGDAVLAASSVAVTVSSALAAEPTKQEPVAYFDLQKQVFYWARPTMIDVPKTIALEPLPLYAAPPATHPGYIIGSHWLETAYSRICAGEAEADVLRDCGWERVDEALRRDAERFRWLRENAAGFSGETLDAAIDAAMKEDTR